MGQVQQRERVILVSVAVNMLDDLDVEEFHLLAQSAGATILEHLTVQRNKPDPKFFVGSGKAEEIAQLVEHLEAELVIFDHSLSPAQERNLEKIMKCRVIDRTGLILDIFAQRARTHEGKLQVELAQLKYLSTRLIRGWAAGFEQQKGGIGLKGPGETQLETDRRLIKVRISQLKDKLVKVQHTRTQGRAARQKAAIPTVSLVGYTNAGKSTLFNILANSDVYAADQLFATLDPTLRRLDWDGIGTVVLADTVGFVRDLQHDLVESFKATLEETLEATLLLHVIDSHSPDMHEQIEAVEDVLKEIGADAPVLRVYNKIDLSGDEPKIIYAEPHLPDRVYVSAHSGQGLDLLKQAVQECLMGQLQNFELILKPAYGKLRTQLYALNVIQSEHYDDEGNLHLKVSIAPHKLEQLIRQAHLPLQDILGERANQFKRPLEEFEIKS
ncbi:ribosome rescue GTPase HflX [Acinetobacter ursingii]|uniref:ribosome rescue GTPase HflX n=1 Tax=Acinetobacter ursingii TaxID=108980 RepID=UPI001DE270DE|nr:ribosome rescue GTPase HflX [Acinetobacter ursingii]MEC8057349.1 ribosome rescue GTPase HflX [Pseudomonadota bacterium]NOZ96879.1 GTPase HflX [Gammaproteobacteria bacterium]MCU4358721.1 GTPase HflX [Acinetobacter ursingii]MCU4483780.1 GTPase HflX [Acinetobacter ursingii]MCU4508100.1 GTPase HflX [Acinetobacter ursingii]